LANKAWSNLVRCDRAKRTPDRRATPLATPDRFCHHQQPSGETNEENIFRQSGVVSGHLLFGLTVARPEGKGHRVVDCSKEMPATPDPSPVFGG